MGKLFDLLSEMSRNDAMKKKYLENPDAVMDVFGLSAEERSVLRSESREKIAEALVAESTNGVLPWFLTPDQRKQEEK